MDLASGASPGFCSMRIDHSPVLPLSAIEVGHYSRMMQAMQNDALTAKGDKLVDALLQFTRCLGARQVPFVFYFPAG
jgi:hypothetical protein